MFLVCAKPQRFSAVQKWCPGISLRVSLGSDEDNIRYCTKPETKLSDPQEVGDRRVVGQGKRTDMMVVSDAIVGGARYDQIADTYPLAIMKWERGIKALLNSRSKHRDRKDPPLVVCFFGAAGIGKTWSVMDIVEKKGYTSEDVYSCESLKWWDGYQQQRFVIIDEVDKLVKENKEAGFRLLLKILDKYALSVEVKGGFVKFNSPCIFLCGTTAPAQWVPDTGATTQQIERRIQHCYTRYAQGEPWLEVPMFKPPPVVKVEEVAPVVHEIVDDDDDIQVVAVEDDPNWIQGNQGSAPLTPTLMVPEEEDSFDMGDLPWFE